MRFLACFAAALVLAASMPANAVQVDEVANFVALRAYNGAATSVNVDGRLTANDGGGGEFVQNGDTDHFNCASGDDDDGVIIVGTNSPHPCWYRQFNGPVHLTWYGVSDAADPSCYASESAFQSCAADTTQHSSGSGTIDALLNARNAANNKAKLPGVDGGILTDGRSIAVWGEDLEIPGNQYFACNAPPGGLRTQLAQNPMNATPYYTLPNSIVLNPEHTIRRDANSLLFSCIVRPTWYNATQLGLVTSTRTLIDNIEHKFTGK